MGRKRIYKILLYAGVLIIVLNGTRLLIEEHRLKDIPMGNIGTESNLGNHAQGNYVIYTTSNGVWSMPFIFGSRIYLYDIENDKDYLIQNQKGIFQEWGTKMCFLGQDILAEGGRAMGNPPSEVKLLSLNGQTQSFDEIGTWNMALTEDSVFLSGDTYGSIYEVNRKTGAKHKVLESGENELAYFWVYNNRLFAIQEVFDESDYDTSEVNLIIKSLSNGKQEKHVLEEIYPSQIFTLDDEKLLFIGIDKEQTWKVVTYNCLSREYEEAAILAENDEEHSYTDWNGFVDGDVLYCNDRKNNLVKIDLESGSQEILIDSKEIGSGIRECVVSYCSDYIVMEVWYKHAKKLLVFDYEGNLIRKKILH